MFDDFCFLYTDTKIVMVVNSFWWGFLFGWFSLFLKWQNCQPLYRLLQIEGKFYWLMEPHAVATSLFHRFASLISSLILTSLAEIALVWFISDLSVSPSQSFICFNLWYFQSLICA